MALFIPQAPETLTSAAQAVWHQGYCVGRDQHKDFWVKRELTSRRTIAALTQTIADLQAEMTRLRPDADAYNRMYPTLAVAAKTPALSRVQRVVDPHLPAAASPAAGNTQVSRSRHNRKHS
jgi:hypothetical protein